MKKFTYGFTSVLLGGFLIASIVTPFLVSAEESMPFTDVLMNDHYYDAIQYVSEVGIVDGYSDGTYRANDEINRDEFVKIMVNSVFTPDVIEGCTNAPFTDIPANDQFLKYICVAHKEGIVTGYTDGLFRAKNKISVGESAKVVANSFGLVVEGPEVTYGNVFEPYLDVLAEKNYIPDTVEGVDSMIKRGEMGEYIYRVKQDITTKPSKQIDDIFTKNCNWCGSKCVDSRAEMLCTTESGPIGKSCELVSGKCEIVDNKTEPTSCRWCGSSCTEYKRDMMCPTVMPPIGQSCELIDEKCEAVTGL